MFFSNVLPWAPIAPGSLPPCPGSKTITRFRFAAFPDVLLSWLPKLNHPSSFLFSTGANFVSFVTICLFPIFFENSWADTNLASTTKRQGLPLCGCKIKAFLTITGRDNSKTTRLLFPSNFPKRALDIIWLLTSVNTLFIDASSKSTTKRRGFSKRNTR